jgi:periplasmic protein TonB
MQRLNFSAPLPIWLAKLDHLERLAVTLFLSATLHLFVIFFLHFKFPDLNKLADLTPSLEVVLVNSKSPMKLQKADALAQANLDGGGNTDQDRRAKSPLPVKQRDNPQPDETQTQQQVKSLELKAQEMLTQLKATHSIESLPEAPHPAEEPNEAPNTLNMVQRSLEMARLEAQISQDMNTYQKRPKRTFIGARTKEYRFARYVEDWRAKVERVGNLNYPEAAKQQKLYGNLQLTVSIRADGSVEAVEINQSSGQKILDEAAKRIVRLAAPYAQFPEDIRKDTDILSITRTWAFTRADQLVGE